MYNKLKLLFLLLFAFTTVNSQKKDITLNDIWQYKFYPRHLNSLNSMNGDFYSLLNTNRSSNNNSIDKYSYKTQTKVATIVSSSDLKEVNQISSYSFNNDETKIIIGTNLKPIFRHSKKGTYYVYDISSKKLNLIGKQIQEPTFSPDSKKVAYVKSNNIFIKDFEKNKLTQVTTDGKINKIINGITDWVYEEEFGFVRAFEWSTNSDKLAFIRFDESKVPTFSMDIYGRGLYPKQQVFKYPKAGEKNATVSLHIYDTKKNKSTKVELGKYEYIPRLQWTKNNKHLSVTTLNRHQNNLNLFFVNAKTFKAKVVLNEKDKAYVDVQDNLTFLDDNSFIWTSEKDGYNHIYLYNKDGKLLKQITKGSWEVTKYYGLNKNNNTIYYQSVENGSINRGVYSIKLNGKSKKLLTPKAGYSEASFSKNFNYFINNYSSATSAPKYSLYEKGKKIKTLLDNTDLERSLKAFQPIKKEFSTIKINGNELNMWMLKPTNFSSTKKYPLLLFQYSGPGSQQVKNSWNSQNDYWHHLIAQKGVIVVCVDGRGTGFKGRDFKKITQLKLGKYEVEDQISVAKELRKLPYINPKKIGIWGWSFGGFMSTNCLLQGNSVFSTAIAVAPVTSWRYYDSVYTERYMTTPQENSSGYDNNSPLSHASKLKGNYLLIHGSGDDNVHVQNATQMINMLIAYNKDFDSEIYPDRTHGIYRGRNTRLHLFRKMTKFLEENLIK